MSQPVIKEIANIVLAAKRDFPLRMGIDIAGKTCQAKALRAEL